MNKQGFTLVEMLGTLVLLGILSSIAVVSVNKYLVQSRQKAYKLMSKAVYEATLNCVIKGKCDTTTVTTDYLINNGFLKKLENPLKNSNNCTGTVKIAEYGRSTTEFKDNYYEVQIICPNYSSATLIWPYSKTAKNVEKHISNSTSNRQDFLNSKNS